MNLVEMSLMKISLIRISLIEMSLMGAGMILVILLLRALLKKRLSTSVIMILWYAAVLRLLVPVSVAVPVPAGVGSWLSGIFRWNEIGEAVGSGVPKKLKIWTKQLDMEQMEWLTDLSDTMGVAKWDVQIPVAAMIWLVGMVFVTGYFLVSYIRCRRVFRESLPVKDDKLQSILMQMKLGRTVQLRSLDRITSPLTYGVLKPVILLPKHLLNGETDKQLKDDLLQCILLHEGVHIRRWDVLTKLMMAAVLAVHWFNPCVWLLYLFVNRDVELCCDEAVIRKMGEDRRSFYATALLYMEEVRGRNSVLYTCFSRNVLEERIRMIMERKKITKFGVILGGVVVVGVCTAFALNADKSNASDDFGVGVKEQNIVAELVETTDVTLTSKMVEAENQTEMEKLTSAEQEEVLLLETTLNELVWPAEGCEVVTSTFGNRVHPITGEVLVRNHITISGESGSESKGALIYAVADGVVKETGFDTEKGNYVVLEHAAGLSTMYTYCETLKVESGMRVQQGDTIATLGQTGVATGACLGFYVYQDGEAQDPLMYYQQ